MTPFMWGKTANKPIYFCVRWCIFDFDTEIPKVICFNIEDVLSYVTVSPEVRQLHSWLIPWLNFVTKGSGASHLSALPPSD